MVVLPSDLVETLFPRGDDSFGKIEYSSVLGKVCIDRLQLLEDIGGLLYAILPVTEPRRGSCSAGFGGCGTCDSGDDARDVATVFEDKLDSLDPFLNWFSCCSPLER